MPPTQTHATATPESRGKLIALGIFLPALASVFVGLRFWVRRFKGVEFGLDDGLIICGAVLVWGMGITQAIGASAGDLGQPIAVLPNGQPKFDHESVIFLQNEWAFQILEKPAFGFIKLSILFFYRRIFIGRWFNIATWTLVAIVTAWFLAFFWITIFECGTHFSAIWSTNRALFLASCIPVAKFLLPFAWSDVITDVLILIIPIPMVAQLHMPTKKKIQVLCVFILGFLTVLAGVARLIFFYRATEDHYGSDVPINTAPTIYWSLVEAAVAVVAACLPLLRPLFKGFAPESLLGSLRERISLRSMRGSSEGSNGSKRKPSTVEQQKTKNGAVYAGENVGESWSEAVGSGVKPANKDGSAKDEDHRPLNEIRVTKTFTSSTAERAS